MTDATEGLKVLERAHLRERVSSALDAFIAHQVPIVSAASSELIPFTDSVTSLLSGGKRLRPAFAYWGFRAVGGADSDELVRAVASLEFIQACALIHDDVIDGSDTRRGKPSAHKYFEGLHQSAAWNGSSSHFGVGAAILLGDLCLSWADEMLYASGMSSDQLGHGKPYLDIMRTEVMAGQYLDLLEQSRQTADIDTIRQVMIHKSAKYTIERPLHFGASMSGATAEQLTALTHYAIPLGVAFQLRDDVLGIFGDPEHTGKPAGDDIREGKRTMLIARTLHACSDTEATVIKQALGNAELSSADINQVRDIITNSGALEIVETDIARGRDVALAALHETTFTDEATDVLTHLAIAATDRAR